MMKKQTIPAINHRYALNEPNTIFMVCRSWKNESMLTMVIRMYPIIRFMGALFFLVVNDISYFLNEWIYASQQSFPGS